MMGEEGGESTVTRSFMSLKENLQALKKGLAQDIKALRKDFTDVGDMVSALEDKETPRQEGVEHLRQEVLHLQEQHIELLWNPCGENRTLSASESCLEPWSTSVIEMLRVGTPIHWQATFRDVTWSLISQLR
ncbi:hypothetical protein NDU88_004533 [Pleurodeles waltl]|uniref:Cytokine receptor-like factor 3 n=1 Tax=Pleurodeles waltl TaxID=8319 RepID=A0AAV7QF64_PLEWA|nr:hypothetical protein NDU88_004533 [Pleurodeles waltl]